MICYNLPTSQCPKNYYAALRITELGRYISKNKPTKQPMINFSMDMPVAIDMNPEKTCSGKWTSCSEGDES